MKFRIEKETNYVDSWFTWVQLYTESSEDW